MTHAVVTVRGPIEPSALGRTSIHEHLLLRLDHVAFSPLDTDEGRRFAEAPLTLENRWFANETLTAMRDNLVLDDETLAATELALVVDAGGGAIVDCTTDGFGRDPAALARISEAAGVHVVMGAGYYVQPAHPAWLATADGAAITDRIVGDLAVGVDDTGIRAGFIGEVGCSWPLTDDERRSLRAAGRAQAATGAAVLVHPGRDRAAPAEIVAEPDDARPDLARVAIAHIERTLPTTDEVLALARTGVRLSFDSFGVPAATYVLDPRIQLPDDEGRARMIGALLDGGFPDHVLVGHDVCTKTALTAYGGRGYGHVFRALPALMAQAGRADASDLLLIDNPAAFLAREVTE